MSYLSDKRGRPKEGGGHRRVDITVDKSTYDALQAVENMSQYVEYCVNTSAHSRWIRFFQPETTQSFDCNKFETAATFVWTPSDCTNNAILSLACHFKYTCTGEGFRFRLCINNSATSPIEVMGSDTWTTSRIYTVSSFPGGIDAFPNQDGYVIEFQFQPNPSSNTSYVKDVSLYLDVADGMPAFSCKSQERVF